MTLHFLVRAVARAKGSLAYVLDRSGPGAKSLLPARASAFRSVLQGIALAGAALFTIGASVLVVDDVDAATVCAVPGRDNPATSGIVNSYWGGGAIANPGTNTQITLGAQRTGSTNTPYGTMSVPTTGISAGDLLIVMQMQGANAGAYEYVTAVSPAGPTTTGTITVRGTGTNGALVNSYTQNYSTGNTFQIIRVPQALNLTIGNYTSPTWDVGATGAGTGGVFAVDVAQQANLSGTINVSGQGFRGGAGFNLTGSTAGLTPTTLSYSSGDTTGGSKGEGTQGTPGYVFDGYALTIKEYGTAGLLNAAYPTGNAPLTGTNAVDGNYTAGSFGFGAIGNAGGGGNDAVPGGTGTNQYNSGGAGGGSAGRGAQGGWTWVGTPAYCNTVGFSPATCPFLSTGTGTGEGITDGGGRSGNAIGGLSAGMVVLGGGGGAASVNNNPVANNQVTTYPPIDVAVDPTTLSGGSATSGNGAAGPITGSGARGGGIVLIRAGTFNAGAGQILANGIRAYNQFGAAASEAAGGGGGGGAVVVLATAASGSLSVSAAGGRGGDSDYFSHGPGGGGGGGFVLTNFSLSGVVDKGGSGYTPNIGGPPSGYTFPNHYGSDAVDGVPGFMSTAGGTTPGTSSGAACSPDLAATVTMPANAAPGAAINGSFNYVDNGPGGAIGVGVTASLTPGLTAVVFTSFTTTTGGVVTTLTGVTGNYNATTGVITFTGLPTTLAAGTTLAANFNTTMPASGASVTGTDTVSESTTDPIPSNNNGTATTVGTAADDDVTTITGLPANAAGGTALNGILTFSNDGPSTSAGTTYTATLPPGATIGTIQQGGVPVTGVTATVAANGVVTFTGMPTTIAVGSAGNVTVPFSVSMPANGSSISATASVSSSTNDTNLSNNTATAIVTGTGSADLATTITGVPTTAQPAGTTITGSVNFNDTNGPNSGVNPVYTVQVPPGSTINAASVLYNGAPINGLTVTIDQYGNVTFGGTGLPTTLAHGDTISIPFTATMPANGSAANVVSSISSPITDPNLANNNATATTPGIAEADVQSTVTGFVTYAQAIGTSETGTVTFSNAGPSIATGVTYTTTLSGTPTITNGTVFPVQYNGATLAGATATYNNGVITYSGLPATLNVGDKVTVAVTFAMPGNSVTVASNISATTADPVPSNNAGSETIEGGNDLSTAIGGFATPQATGTTGLTGTVTFSNVSGATAATGTYTPVLTLTPNVTVTALTCTNGVTAAYTAGTGNVAFTGLPALASGANFVCTFTYTMPANNVVVNSSVSETPNIDDYAANNSATTTVVNGAVAKSDMGVTITGMPGVAAAGSTVSAVLNYTNNSAANAATNTSFAATLPIGATVSSITLNGTVIPGATATVGSNGVVTFANMPTTVAASAVVAVNFSFPMPANGSSATATGTITSSNDSNNANNTASATETGDAATDLQTTVVEPATAAASSTISGTVHYLNNGPANAINPTYTLTLPTAGGTPTITSVMLNGSLLSVTTSIAANGVVTFTNMPTTLSPGDDLAVAFTAKMPSNGNSISTTGSISYPGTDTNPANNAATGTTTSSPNAPTVMVTKTVNHTTQSVNSSIAWTLAVTNTGTIATTGAITLTDTLPANISAVTVTPTGATCTPSTVSAGTQLVCTVPAGLAASGGVASILVGATLNATGTYSNTVVPSGNSADNPTCAANACTTVTVVGSATVQIQKTSVNGTGAFAYTMTNLSNASDNITTTNQNTATPGVISVVTALTSATTLTEATPPTGYTLTSATCADTNYATDGGTQVVASTLAGNVLTIAANKIVSNATIVCTFTNTITQALKIAKTGPATMSVGNPASYTLTVTNSSTTQTVTTGQVKDQLPASLTFNSATGSGWTCSAAAGLITCNFAGTISPSGVSTITVNATPTATGNGIINYASIDPTGGSNAQTPGTGCTPAADCANFSTNVISSGLSVAKSAPTPALTMGTNSSYSLVVTNNNATAATTARVLDQLPVQLTFVSATGTNWTCTNASGLITCNFAGTIGAGLTSTITVTVKPASDAVTGSSVTNYASIDPTGGTAPPTPGTNCTPAASCTSNTSTISGPNIAVTKTVDSPTHAVGDTITWTLTASNTGNAANAGIITLVDTLPTGISTINVTSTANEVCTPTNPAAGGQVTCTIAVGKLAATNGVLSATITAVATTIGNETNTATASGPDTPTCAPNACTATTTVSGQTITLNEALSGARISNTDQFTDQIKSPSSVIASATTTGTGNTVANGSTGETTVTAGTVYTLTQIAAGSTTLTNYTQTLVCTNANAASTTVLPTTVGGTVTPAAGDRITCTITNSAQPVVTLTKALNGTRVHGTDQFTVEINQAATTVASATTTGTGSSVANGSTGATALTGGTTYTLTEIAAAGSGTLLADYTSALACTNSTTGSATTLPTTVGGTVTPAAGDNITCTLTNTPKQPVITLLGTLTGTRAANSDQFTFAIATGGTTTATTTTTGTGGALTNNSTGATTVVSGSTYSLTEAAAGTTNLAQYTSTLSCSNTDASSTTVLPTTLPGSIMPSVGDNITCTIAIVPKVPTITLVKALGSNREANTDQFTIQINAGATNVATATTTGTGNGLANNTTGVTNVVTGTTYTLTEVLRAARRSPIMRTPWPVPTR